MKVKLLGSGSWEGIPAPFSNDKVSVGAKWNKKDFRFRPCLEVKNKKETFLIEIPPDIRLISSKFKLYNVNKFLVSHWHFDHLYGLFELQCYSEFVKEIEIYCSHKTAEWIQQKFGHMLKHVKIIELQAYVPVKINGVKITPLPVKHMSSRDTFETEDNTLGFLLEDGKNKIAYMADCCWMPDKTKELIKEIDVAVLEGVYLFEDKINEQHAFYKLKQDPDHMHGEEIIKIAKEINAKKTVFHHISRLTDMNHEQLQEELKKKDETYFIGYDGMKL
jgi:phosphoribosyl 1,2-cyclic phosphate phosphodiesterase